MSILKWAHTVLYHPKQFFTQDAKKIIGWTHPIRYLVTFSLFVTVFLTWQHLSKETISIFNVLFNYIFDKLSIDWELPTTYISPTNALTIYAVLVFFLITSSLVRYWVIHWFVAHYNKKATFQDTYKALSFSTTPGWLAMPFFVLSSFILYQALATNWWLSWVLFALCTLIFLALEIYSIYVRTQGLSITQNIKPLHAFLSIYIYSAVAYTLLVIFLLAMIVGFMLAVTVFMAGKAGL